jgi:hypothetical protein
MAQADAVTPPTPLENKPASSAPATPRFLVIAALLGLVAFAAVQGRSLWQEWQSLQGEMSVVRRTAVIGYVNIHPNPSYALKPVDWFHEEGDSTLVWSGWKQGDGHQWFRVRRGDLTRSQLSEPMGRDVVQAIDYPIVESQGGTIWRKIPNDALVVGQELAGVVTVCPVQVLAKVGVVNDTVHDHPFLFTYNPHNRGHQAVHVYEPVVGGHRITMGWTGYFQENEPLLYDRGTESFWVENAKGNLEAIAGKLKGSEIRQLGVLTPMNWSDFRGRYPRSRLIVGADRSKGIPQL